MDSYLGYLLLSYNIKKEQLDKLLIATNSIIIGSTLLQIMTKNIWHDSDLDFVTDTEKGLKKLTEYIIKIGYKEKEEKYEDVYFSGRLLDVKTFINEKRKKIQILLTEKSCDNYCDYLTCTDIDICANYYNGDKLVTVNKDATVNKYATRKNYINKERMDKYNKRGFIVLTKNQCLTKYYHYEINYNNKIKEQLEEYCLRPPNGYLFIENINNIMDIVHKINMLQ